MQMDKNYNRHQKSAASSASAISSDYGSQSPRSDKKSDELGLRKRKVNKKTKAVKKSDDSDESSYGTGVLLILRKLWATRQTEDIDKEKEPDRYVKVTIRELIVYMIFLLVLCIITFGMTSPVVYYWSTILQNQFIGATTTDQPFMAFTDIYVIDDVWRYLEQTFVSGLYSNMYDTNYNITEDFSQYMLNENRLLGLPRMRQLKVRGNSCIVHDDFKEEIKFCYDSYASMIEDQEPFGIWVSQNVTNDSAWYYQSESALKGSTVQGLVNSYGGGGFIATLSTDHAVTLNIITELKNNLWITRGTRAIFIDFTLYNANINLFSQVRLVFEFPATGGVVPSYTFRISKLIRYVTPSDYIILACEIIFLMFILYFTIEELIEICKHGVSYFKAVWNILDVVLILISYVCIAFNIFRQFKVNTILDGLLANEQQFPDFEFLCYWQMQFNNAVGGVVFLAWMKIFKYTSFNKTMTQLTETLGRCAKDVAGFAIMFFIIFFAYAQLGYLIFGTQVHDFSTFQYSIYTLFRIILGDFDYDAIERAQRALGPMYFLTYIFFVFFVLLNMFLAIINDTYSEVKSEIVKSEIELSSFLKKGYNKVLEKYNLKATKIIDIQHALAKADVNCDNQIDFDEWRNDLRSKGYADMEIETLFAKYDLDGDRILNQIEQKKMYEDMSKQDEELKAHLKKFENIKEEEADEGGEKKKRIPVDAVGFEDYNLLSDRIDKIEHSLNGIVSKVDLVLVKLDTAEKAKREQKVNDQTLNNKDRLSAGSGGSQSFC